MLAKATQSKSVGIIFASVATMGLAAESAFASTTLAWVSGSGSDVGGCGDVATPCRTLQYAHDNAIVASGVIAIRDSGDFGYLRITKSISIVNDGSATAIVSQPAAGQNAVVVSTPATGKVVLRGLTIDGSGGGSMGVYFNRGGALSIEKCSVRNFVSSGVALSPTQAAKIKVSDTVIENNGGHGMYLQPISSVGTANVFADFIRVEVTNNALMGIGVYGNWVTGLANTRAVATDSVSSNNGGAGFYSLGGPNLLSSFTVVRSTANGNGNVGMWADANATVLASQDTLEVQNDWGAWKKSGVNSYVYSYGDNLTNQMPTIDGRSKD